MDFFFGDSKKIVQTRKGWKKWEDHSWWLTNFFVHHLSFSNSSFLLRFPLQISGVRRVGEKHQTSKDCGWNLSPFQDTIVTTGNTISLVGDPIKPLLPLLEVNLYFHYWKRELLLWDEIRSCLTCYVWNPMKNLDNYSPYGINLIPSSPRPWTR